MNTELFTGKAQAYADARPGYPDAVLEYKKSCSFKRCFCRRERLID
ncbi:MAG: hypothetical protein FWD14_08270 [Treponema sp.]|nr:hypothetical protein [Treponema sp.]